VDLTEETMLQALDIEAVYQACRADLAVAKTRRDQALYAAWREVRDPRAAARCLPRTITAAAVRAAVIRMAPPVDFVPLVLFPAGAERN
jgi:hypothetical protein